MVSTHNYFRLLSCKHNNLYLQNKRKRYFIVMSYRTLQYITEECSLLENNYNNNGFNNGQPCKPFTESQNNAQPSNTNAVPLPPDDRFTRPSAPAANNIPPQTPAAPQPKVDFSQVSYERYEMPVNNNFETKQTPYQNNRMNNTPYQAQPNIPVQMPVQNPAQQYYTPVFHHQPQPMAPDMNNNMNANGYGQPNAQPVSPYDYRTNPAANPQYNPNIPNTPAQPSFNQEQLNYAFNPNTYAPNAPYSHMPAPPMMQPQKKKLGAGVIVIIVVLSILFAGSLAGLIVVAANNNKASDDEGVPDSSFDFTIPESGKYDFNTNLDSDYSDKVNPDYKGIDLKAKPKNQEGVTYNAEYANSVVCDSVVAILCYYDEIDDSEDYASEGSGIILTSDGYVITNAHVIDNSKTAYAIEIVTSDGKRYHSGVVGYDERTDLALLKMDDASNLKPADFCNTDQISLGEEVICVGNPGGIAYSNSVTKGIVSAVNRQISDSSNVKYIQTDAPINPGNSGGPVVNMYGQVIGIATSKIVSETYEGMGFAIPSNTVKDIIDELMKNGYVSGRVKIGITGFNVTPQEAAYSEIPQGIRVESIDKDGPCHGTGLKKGDIIIKADSKDVKTFADFFDLLGNYSAGDKIELTYYRPDTDKTGTVTITLQADK